MMVDLMTFSSSPSTHQELCLMHTFISKLCNCLRNAYNSVAVLDEKKNKQTETIKSIFLANFFV